MAPWAAVSNGSIRVGHVYHSGTRGHRLGVDHALPGDQVKGSPVTSVRQWFPGDVRTAVAQSHRADRSGGGTGRGSLDVLLATPLSTDRIVLSKWWGTYRIIPALALLPAIGSVFIAATEPTFPPASHGAWRDTRRSRLTSIDRIAHVCFPMACCWCRGRGYQFRPVAGHVDSSIGRAVAASVVCSRRLCLRVAHFPRNRHRHRSVDPG